MKRSVKVAVLLICLCVIVSVFYIYYPSIYAPAPSPTTETTETPTPSPTTEYAGPATIIIVDSSGKYVEVPWPVKRIAALTTDSAMAVVVLGARDRLVGITRYAAGEPWAPNVTDIGTCFSPNIEAIIQAKPEVVLTYVDYPKPEDLEGRLEPLGIKVIRVDLYKPETMFMEFNIIGLVLNLTDEAERIVKYWRNVSSILDSRIAGLREKVRVYWEGYTDYTAAGPGTGWDTILRLSGGVNVFADSPVSSPKVSSETIIARNPEVILKSISSTKYNPYRTLDTKPLEDIRKSIMDRPGWSEIKAVKEGRVYLICAAYLHYLFGQIAERAYVAKILYPSLLEDVDPKAMLKTWIEDNLKMEWREGTWVYPSP